jgi:ubiquinone/menaquinone biosynthesis C-methylase UbiE
LFTALFNSNIGVTQSKKNFMTCLHPTGLTWCWLQGFSLVLPPLYTNMQEVYKTLAEQLKKPQGELAIQVGEKMNEINDTINKLSIGALDLSKGDHLLEIGMANGYFVKDIFKKQPDLYYYGCDHSVKMVYEANRLNEDMVNAKRVSFFIADAINLPFEDEIFDKVMVVATLYYFDNLEAVFKELQRVMKPNGQLLVSIRPKTIMQLYGTSPFADHMFTKEELMGWISESGFKLVSITEHAEPDIRVLDEDIPSSCIIAIAAKN